MRNRDGEDSDGDTRATVRFNAPQEPSALRERERVLDTEDASRGPLSGIFRLTDSPRVMKKLNDCERADKRKKDESAQPQHQKAQVRQPLLLAGPPSPSVALRRPPTPNSSHPHP
jgi:tripartite motif-containing protein 71